MVTDKSGKIFDDRRKNTERRVKEQAVSEEKRQCQRRTESKKK